MVVVSESKNANVKLCDCSWTLHLSMYRPNTFVFIPCGHIPRVLCLLRIYMCACSILCVNVSPTFANFLQEGGEKTSRSLRTDKIKHFLQTRKTRSADNSDSLQWRGIIFFHVLSVHYWLTLLAEWMNEVFSAEDQLWSDEFIYIDGCQETATSFPYVASSSLRRTNFFFSIKNSHKILPLIIPENLYRTSIAHRSIDLHLFIKS